MADSRMRRAWREGGIVQVSKIVEAPGCAGDGLVREGLWWFDCSSKTIRDLPIHRLAHVVLPFVLFVWRRAASTLPCDGYQRIGFSLPSLPTRLHFITTQAG